MYYNSIGQSDRQQKSQIGSNAPPHTARITKHWLANNGIAVLAWPPYFPDLDSTRELCVGTRELFEAVCTHLECD